MFTMYLIKLIVTPKCAEKNYFKANFPLQMPSVNDIYKAVSKYMKVLKKLQLTQLFLWLDTGEKNKTKLNFLTRGSQSKFAPKIAQTPL